jgi:hypothetical protein
MSDLETAMSLAVAILIVAATTGIAIMTSVELGPIGGFHGDRPRRSGLDRKGGAGGGAAHDVAVAVVQFDGQGGVGAGNGQPSAGVGRQ